MTMRALDLDFRSARPGSPWAGRLLLALSVAFAADTGLAYRNERQALEQNQLALARIEPRARQAHAVRVAAPEELSAARETIERLSLPWDRLLAAIESAATEHVALLGIEPDAKSGTVTISGEGKDYLAALSYVLNLSRIEGLRAVHLVRHEQHRKDPQRPVSFVVSAAWK